MCGCDFVHFENRVADQRICRVLRTVIEHRCTSGCNGSWRGLSRHLLANRRSTFRLADGSFVHIADVEADPAPGDVGWQLPPALTFGT